MEKEGIKLHEQAACADWQGYLAGRASASAALHRKSAISQASTLEQHQPRLGGMGVLISLNSL